MIDHSIVVIGDIHTLLLYLKPTRHFLTVTASPAHAACNNVWFFITIATTWSHISHRIMTILVASDFNALHKKKNLANHMHMYLKIQLNSLRHYKTYRYSLLLMHLLQQQYNGSHDITWYGLLPSIISLQESMATSRAVSPFSFSSVISAPASSSCTTTCNGGLLLEELLNIYHCMQ